MLRRLLRVPHPPEQARAGRIWVPGPQRPALLPVCAHGGAGQSLRAPRADQAAAAPEVGPHSSLVRVGSGAHCLPRFSVSYSCP